MLETRRAPIHLYRPPPGPLSHRISLSSAYLQTSLTETSVRPLGDQESMVTWKSCALTNFAHRIASANTITRHSVRSVLRRGQSSRFDGLRRDRRHCHHESIRRKG